MTCEEVRRRAPLYLSGELEEDERARVEAHLAGCAACEGELEGQAAVDEMVAQAVAGQAVDATRVERAVRERMRPRRRAWMAAAAGLLALAAAAWWVSGRVPRAYADAARDHRVEVVEGQARRWRSGAEEIGALAAQSGLTWEQVEGLARAGYLLERAKYCGIDGERMLHLVFGDGAKRYSVFVRPKAGAATAPRQTRRGEEEVAAFETGRYRALVVTDGPAAECKQLTEQILARL